MKYSPVKIPDRLFPIPGLKIFFILSDTGASPVNQRFWSCQRGGRVLPYLIDAPIPSFFPKDGAVSLAS